MANELASHGKKWKRNPLAESQSVAQLEVKKSAKNKNEYRNDNISQWYH
jgi:hypothetical protein